MDVRRRNHVRVTGRADGPVVMLAHGFGCGQNMWRLVVPMLERDFTVVRFDHVGAGRSDLPAWSEKRYGSLDGYADDVRELCREPALGPVTFVGHSVSAMMGVLAAAREPEAFTGLGPVRRIRAGDIEELLEALDANHLGWSGAMAAVIMGNPDR
ncbi:alpha/beta fold hydrolase, partial [Streptomyces sp. NPDC006324]